MHSLNTFPMNAGYFLLNYGISTSMKAGGVNAIFGQTAAIFDDDEICEFLSAGLLLDGEAANILQERGFGSQLGCTINEVVGREDDRFAIETVTANLPGLRKGFYMNANLTWQIMKIEPAKGASEITSIIYPDGKRFGAGMTAFGNSLGGRVVVWSTPNPLQLAPCDQRQALTQLAVSYAAGSNWPEGATVRGGPYLQPILFTCGSACKLVIANGSADEAVPVVEGAFLKKKPDRAFILEPLAHPHKTEVKPLRDKGAVSWQFSRAIPHHGFAVLEWD